MVGHLFQNYDTIDVRAVFFPRILAIIPATRYTWVLVPRILAFFPALWVQTRIYICAQKSPFLCVTNKHVVYGVTESRRIRGTEFISSAENPLMYDGAER